MSGQDAKQGPHVPQNDASKFAGRIITVYVGFPEVRSAIVKGANNDTKATEHDAHQSKPDQDFSRKADEEPENGEESSLEVQASILEQAFSDDDDDDDSYDTEDCEAEERLPSRLDDDDEFWYSSSEEETIEVVECQTFFIHEEVLCSSGAFLNNALEKNREEGKSSILTLPFLQGQDFEFYAAWLYTGRITSDAHDRLQECYELGKHLCDADFNDALIGSISKEPILADKRIVDFLFYKLYAISRKNSPHRKLAVDLFLDGLCRSDNPEKWLPDLQHLNTAFTRDIMLAVVPRMRRGAGMDVFQQGGAHMCRYHEHANGGECYKERRKELFED